MSLCLAETWKSFLETLALTHVPLSMGDSIFVLPHDASASTNKPDRHYRSCLYCIAVRHASVNKAQERTGAEDDVNTDSRH